MLIAIVLRGPVLYRAHAEARVVDEVEGKETSLALLKLALEHPAGRFCGAKRADVVIRVKDDGEVSTETKNARDIKRDDALRIARSLGENQAVTVLFCEGEGKDLIATGTTVTRVNVKGQGGWTATVVKTGKPAPVSDKRLSDAELERVLAESSRELNKSLPMIVEAGLRLDNTVGKNKVLLYNYTLTEHDASAVDAREFERGMTKRLRSSVCADEEMRVLFDQGARYRYRYRGRDRKVIATITVKGSDCC